jgi:small nuclear ribonucleoprotein (snRNP)-like protein
MSSKSPARIALTIVAVSLALFAAACQRTASAKAVSPNIDPNRYYAVLLSNGAVYYGRLQGVDSNYPVLRDVYYIQTSVNPQTKATSSVLVKRGKELHAPNEMIINKGAIMLIEPVGADSKVAQLIEESGKTQ